jgi:hypothetical protein
MQTHKKAPYTQPVNWTEPSTLDWTKLLLAFAYRTSARTVQKPPINVSSIVSSYGYLSDREEENSIAVYDNFLATVVLYKVIN